MPRSTIAQCVMPQCTTAQRTTLHSTMPHSTMPRSPLRHAARFCSASLLLLLAACGGGGGSSTPPAPPPAPPAAACEGASVFVVADASVPAGKTAGAAIGGCGAPLGNLQWTQTAGPAVTLLADKTQAISFEVPQPGTYSFTVRYSEGNGPLQTRSVTINATAAPTASRVTVRTDQAVRAGGSVSLRAWETLAAGDALATNGIGWQQIEGPTVTLDTTDARRPLFTAPAVTRDTLLRFRVTLRTAQGTTDTDEALVLVENYAQAPSDSNAFAFRGLHVSRTYAYRPNGPFAASLVRCTYDAALQYTSAANNTLCPLATLPFLHQTTGGTVPTTAQIMDRVVVSHDWMGQVFEQFLNSGLASDDMKRMFNGVTAVVIGAAVRPSFYYALTGAIYLDANNFWLTPEQRDVINERPDFRSDFDRDLQYSGLWRYTENNQNIFLAFPPNLRTTRPLDYLLREAGWLIYHELGHAADFLPPAVRGSLNGSLTAWDNIAPRYAARQLPSDQLDAQLGLTSSPMRALAQVKFQLGPQSNPNTVIGGFTYAQLTAITPQQAAGFFSGDRASDEYNYSTTYEDIAMLLEEFLMQRNHPFRRDVAITDKITAGSTGNNLIVRWGQRGRIGETAVRPRVQLVVQQLTPWVLAADPNAIAAIPAPLAMRPGESWNANLTLPAPPPGLVGAASARLPALSFEEDRMLLARALGGPHGGVLNLDAPAGSSGFRPFGHWTPNDRWLEGLR
ncbi:MAG: hypothetical protein ACK540_04245 [Betaproteobacteria bacterium]